MDLNKYTKETKEGSGKSKTYITYNQDHKGYEICRKLRSQNIDIEELVFQELLNKIGK